MIPIRQVRLEDFEAICGHRRRMFEEAGLASATLERMASPFAAWLAPRLKDGRYFGFVADTDGAVVAGIGLVLLDWPPHPLHPETGERGYILNVFVEPGYRGRGLAQEMMRRAEEEFRARGVTYAVLHASALGRPVYEKLGWDPTAEMAKAL